METQLRAISLSALSVEFCVDEGLSADPSEELSGGSDSGVRCQL